VFGDINDADDLPNNSNCRLIIHFTEVNQSGRVGRRFTHVVPAAMVQFEHDPDSNHRVKIDGTAENSDDVVATVFGPSTSPSVVLDNIYNSSSREFHFSTIPTTESTVKVVLTCTSVRGENVDFPFILPVDQVGPTFTPGSIDEQINGNELKWETNAQDTDSKFSGNATDVTVTIVNSSGALVNVSEYDVDVTPLLENTVLNIKVKLLNKTHLTADLYTITIRARDIAGNESPISDEFDIT